MAYDSAEHHPAFEEYTETIYELAEDDIKVIQDRIAERLEVSRPAVSEMVRRMESEGLVTVDDSGVISLTKDGTMLATFLVALAAAAAVASRLAKNVPVFLVG